MSRNNTALWGGLAAGAALGAGVMFGLDMSNLIDPASSLLGGVDASSILDGLNSDGGSGYDGNPYDSSNDFSQDDSSQYQDTSYGNSETNGAPQSGSGLPQHFGHALHSLVGGATTNLVSGNKPLLNRNGLPILQNIDRTTIHSCNHCGESIFGLRVKCLVCPDFDSCNKPGCLALLDHKHPSGHSFLFLPTVGNYLVYLNRVTTAFCQGCREGIPTDKYWSCLGCRDRHDYCTTCFTQGKQQQHIARFPGHLFIHTLRLGFMCDGCTKDISELPWMLCTHPACRRDYGLCMDCYPRALQLHPQHRQFQRTFGCEHHNTPAPPPPAGPTSPTSPRSYAQSVPSPTTAPPQAHPSHHPNATLHAQTYPGPAAQYYPAGITCGMCRRYTIGEWWVCNQCPDNTVCHNCIRPAHAYHGHSFSLVRG